MKSLKSLSRADKPPRGRSPTRKPPLPRKTTQSRISIPRRPPAPGPSSSMKHDMSRPKKTSPLHHSFAARHPPSHGSHRMPISVDRHRAHSGKRLPEYPKQRRLESHHSLMSRKLAPPLHHDMKRISPPLSGPSRSRSGNSGMMMMEMPEFSPPPKKGLHRDHLSPDMRDKRSSGMIPDIKVASMMFSTDHMSSRSSANHYPSSSRQEGYDLPNRSKGMIPHIDVSYSRDLVDKRVRGNESRFISNGSKHYKVPMDKHYTSLHSEQHRDAPRVQFNKDDLENITVDIRRNMRSHSPTVRHIVNPAEVKLVRRPSEGHRPIFDREEVKPFSRGDLQENTYVDPKSYPSSDRGRSASHMMNFKNIQKYEITKMRSEGGHSTSGHAYANTLSERWQRIDTPKVHVGDFDRDDRGYPSHSQGSDEYGSGRPTYRARSAERDFRPVDKHRPRAEYSPPPPPPQKLYHVSPGDLRHNLSMKRKEAPLPLHDARDRISQRRGSDRSHAPPPPMRDYPTNPPKRSARSRSDSRSRMDPPRIHGSSQFSRGHSLERLRAKDDVGLPSYHAKSARFKYDQWSEKLTASPKPSMFYDHDVHKEDSTFSRGSSRNFRGSRHLRGRSSRPFRPRSGFLFKGGLSGRGRGFGQRHK